MKSIEDFSTLYGSLNDAVIHDISLSYRQDSVSPTLKVIVSCMSIEKDESWVYLEIVFFNVKEFKILSLPRTSLEVVYSFACKKFSDFFAFSFSSNVSSLDTVEEYTSSDFYVISKYFDFSELSDIN